MKKILKIVIPLFTIAMFLSTTLVKSDFAVTVGDDEDYDVVTSDWQITVGANNGGGTGYSWESTGYDLTDTLNIEVTAETTGSVDYDCTVDGTTHGYSTNLFGNALFFALSMPEEDISRTVIS